MIIISPLGDNFVSMPFNTISVLVCAILIRQPERRHWFFKWLITILASVFVPAGTVLRIQHIHGHAGMEEEISISEAEKYFTQSLASWIACIIMDGTLAFHIYQAYDFKKLVNEFLEVCTVTKAIEKMGLLITCTSMVRFAYNVYINFHYLTNDISIHTWFFLAVFFKISRIIIQGRLKPQHPFLCVSSHPPPPPLPSQPPPHTYTCMPLPPPI